MKDTYFRNSVDDLPSEGIQRKIAYLKGVMEKYRQQEEVELQEKEQKRKEKIRDLESQFVYCPECGGLTAKLDEKTVCPNCRTVANQLTQAKDPNLSGYLNKLNFNVDFVRYIWKPEYATEVTYFLIRYHGQEFCGSNGILHYTQFDDNNWKAVRLAVVLSENDWHSIREYLQTLNISQWITPCKMFLSYKYSSENLDRFQCSCDRIPAEYTFLHDPDKEYPKEYAELFDFIRQIFQKTEGWKMLESCGTVLEKQMILPDVRVIIRNDDTGLMHCAEIPFHTYVEISNSPKAHILVPSLPIPFALRPQVGHFLIKGGLRFQKVWNGEKWICQDLVKKGDSFLIKGHPFTLIDFEYIRK